eukprot:CAMPEP_0118664068 /NCGR_PEP_ID=MMETSP0785-20121206/17795_1 /TAXON_ID=91992 /ORGANISM="Bolidomonas pacifica, Strain CCMP 1866" /LENGTH=266 /DNA_ID=CAMNT_0006557909 /DNA_START=166 /DNA_END=963 /DNA_ORIENTATION=+
MLRSMFPDSSDSEEEEEEEEVDVHDGQSHQSTMASPITMIDGVTVVQDPSAGISSKLWPAATHLSSYLLRSSSAPSPPPRIIELGAGVGLTGIKLSKAWGSHVILTDLPSALPLLQSNIDANPSTASVTCAPLAWGTSDWSSVVSMCETFFPATSPPSPRPFDLIIAADCVYWEELHAPLRSTLLSLLSSAPDSKCLICGMRRWKSDNSFYKSLGKVRNSEGKLECKVVDEVVNRVERKAETEGYFDDLDGEEREVIRVYEVKFVL